MLQPWRSVPTLDQRETISLKIQLKFRLNETKIQKHLKENVEEQNIKSERIKRLFNRGREFMKNVLFIN